MVDVREVLKPYYHADGKYEPLNEADLETVRLEVNRMIKEMSVESNDTYLEIMSEIIALMIFHYDIISIIQEQPLDQCPYEIIMAIASLMIVDSGYFGGSPVLEIFFSPKENQENERIAMWDRFTVPGLSQKIDAFLCREDVPEEYFQEILHAMRKLERI